MLLVEPAGIPQPCLSTEELSDHFPVRKTVGQNLSSGAYEIVDYRDTATVCSKVLEMSSFNDHKGRYLSMRPDSKTGFISVASNAKYIYTLYDGKELSYYMSNPGIGLRGHNICVFDWDGNYVFRLHSADPVRCISWNEERQSLYLCVLTDSGEYRFGEIPYTWFQDIEIHKEHT